MLSSLTIRNYALISSLEIDFFKGFSVLTGETGAGKSIILGALSLILGQRADTKLIKQNETKCIVEGLFDISAYDLKPFFDEKDIDYDEQNCILRREIHISGKSRAFINDIPVSLTDLKELSTQLIDVHSQHQNLNLSDGGFQLQVIDALADNKDKKVEYEKNFFVYQTLKNKLQALKNEAEQNSKDEDYLRFQFEQLHDARLVADEQESLEREAEILSNTEEIKSNLYHIEQILTDETKGLVISLKEALSAAQSLKKIFPEGQEFSERLESAYFDLKDLAMTAVRCQERVEYDPERLQLISNRLDLLYSLQQKHKVDSVSDLIELRDKIELQLQSIENIGDEIDNCQKELEKTYEVLMTSARVLSKTRNESARFLEKNLVQKISGLGMPGIQFKCELSEKEIPGISGIDSVNFLFSANKNVQLKPVAHIASGGEISRLMLGIKALIAGAMALPTIIFDEIDIGVSGEVADKMANIMSDLGKVMQVISITHLPQIAAKGENHYYVFKKDLENTTETFIRKLSEEERIREIAQMLSGERLTDAALENAKKLLNYD